MSLSLKFSSFLGVILIAVASASATDATHAAEHRLSSGMSIPDVISKASTGDIVRLGAGLYAGPVTIDRSISLLGEEGARIVGPGTGSVVTVTATDVRIEGLDIEGSGIDVPGMDSAIFLSRDSARVTVENNHLSGNLFGVYVHGSADSLVANNVITGRNDLRPAEAGNGVSIWNAPGTRVIGNEIRFGRDGIFVTTSRNNVFADNRFSDLRFAIHYMYTPDSRIVGNRSTNNHVAWAIMFSDRLEIRDNVSIDDRDHGLMLNASNGSVITGNVVVDGREKCVFIYNANRNLFEGNRFEGCPIGIHFTAGSEGNTIVGNAFVSNRTQVKYVGTRLVNWSRNGRGNYWSDNPAFDLDGDGIADQPYRPNDIVDEILWRLPQAKVLLNSPAVSVIRQAQRRFPSLYPGGVIDPAPLMVPPEFKTVPAR